MSLFIPCRKDLNARQFTILFLKEIIRLHGIPRDIITDRGSLFTLELWKHTTEKLGIERQLRMAFYPKMEGQTERINGILEQYLRAYIHYPQDNWNELLPLAEFTYNNGYQETIMTTPFYANDGVNPEHQLITHMMTERITSANGMTELHNTERAEMATAQLRHKENYDRHRKPDSNLKSGNMVWFLPRNIHTTRTSKKLDCQKIGLLKILAKIGTRSYKLAFPPSMKIHNTIYISLLEPYQDNRFPLQIQEPPPPIQIEGEDELKLDEIIASRFHYNKLQYPAKWKEYRPVEDKVWYPAENFNNAADAVAKFHERYPEKPRMAESRKTSSCPTQTSRRVGRFVGHLRPISTY